MLSSVLGISLTFRLLYDIVVKVDGYMHIVLQTMAIDMDYFDMDIDFREGKLIFKLDQRV